jgi:hypothetical protein
MMTVKRIKAADATISVEDAGEKSEVSSVGISYLRIFLRK